MSTPFQKVFPKALGNHRKSGGSHPHDAFLGYAEDLRIHGLGGQDQLGLLAQGQTADIVVLAGNDHVSVRNVVHQHVAVALDDHRVALGVLEQVVADAVAVARNGKCQGELLLGLSLVVFRGRVLIVPEGAGIVKIVARELAICDIEQGRLKIF